MKPITVLNENGAKLFSGMISKHIASLTGMAIQNVKEHLIIDELNDDGLPAIDKKAL